MNQEEQKRLYVLNQVIDGKLVANKAAALLNRSVRQIRRWIASYRLRGAAALIHGNRGRRPVNRSSAKTVNRVVKLARGRYAGFNQQHLSEMLAEREGVHLSRSTVRRMLEKAGIASPRRRRPPKHRSRRERYSQEGMLVQIDGSPHRWFGRNGPKLTLLAAIDDATGKVLGAVFRQQEDAQGYFLLMRMIVENYGCPLAVYRDRHGIFQRQKLRDRTIDEQLESRPNYTQFGRLLSELGIRSIPSHSPQSKGRIERLFGSFQDRLVSELRLAGVRNLKGGNHMLPTFLARYNRRFSVAPQQPGAVYRTPAVTDWNTIFSFKYLRTVGLDNTLRLRQHRIQILSDPHRVSYARTRVEVQERMDGSIAIYYRGRCLATSPAPLEAPVLRVLRTRPLSSLQPSEYASPAATRVVVDATLTLKPEKRLKHWKPPKDHPWRARRELSWDPRFEPNWNEPEPA